jgi:hypothetical protein
MSGAVESDGWREALILGAAKKNKPHISPKTKAILKQVMVITHSINCKTFDIKKVMTTTPLATTTFDYTSKCHHPVSMYCQ